MIAYLKNPNDNPEYFELHIFNKNADFIGEVSFNHIDNKVVIDGMLGRKGYGKYIYDLICMYAYENNSYLCNSLGGLQESAFDNYERMYNDPEYKKINISIDEAQIYASDPTDPFVESIFDEDEEYFLSLRTGYSLKPNDEYKNIFKNELSPTEFIVFKKMRDNLENTFSDMDSLFGYCMEYGNSIIDERLPLTKKNPIVKNKLSR